MPLINISTLLNAYCIIILTIKYYLLRLFLDTRQLYTLIKMVYYKNLPSQVLQDIPTLKPEERSLAEFEEGEKAIELINQDVEFVMKGRKLQIKEDREILKLGNLESSLDVKTF